jgi:hypothetical protein
MDIGSPVLAPSEHHHKEEGAGILDSQMLTKDRSLCNSCEESPCLLVVRDKSSYGTATALV